MRAQIGRNELKSVSPPQSTIYLMYYFRVSAELHIKCVMFNIRYSLDSLIIGTTTFYNSWVVNKAWKDIDNF